MEKVIGIGFHPATRSSTFAQEALAEVASDRPDLAVERRSRSNLSLCGVTMLAQVERSVESSASRSPYLGGDTTPKAGAAKNAVDQPK